MGHDDENGSKERGGHEGSNDAGQDDASSQGAGPAVGTRFTASEIYENVRVAAEDELARTPRSLFWSAVAAGLAIGFSFLAAGFATSLVPAAYRHAAASLGYPLGFAFVIIARNQLFTENTLEPVIPLLHSPSLDTLRKLVVLWATVLAGNLLGALAFAFAVARTRLVEPDVTRSLLDLSREATAGGFVHVFYLAVFAGWLIALGAWLVSSTRSTGAQIALIWLSTGPIAAFGFRHSIAGAVEAFYGAFTHAVAWHTALVEFLLPALLGNIVGGVVLVALVNHQQVREEPKQQAHRPE